MAKLDIPQDIIDNVIDAVGDDTHLLKQCSLVSSSFLLPSRKHLFSRITIRGERSCEGIHQLLDQNPFILPCVKTITINFSRYPEWVDNTSLLVILRLPFCCIERFAIYLPRNSSHCQWDAMDWNHDCESWDWNYFGNEIREGLSNIMFSSTLKSLSLDGMTNLPISFFVYLAPLTTLELDTISPSDFYDDSSSLQTHPASNGVIERCVWRFGSGYAPQMLYAPPPWIFLPFVYRLRYLEIYINLSSGTDDDFHALAFLILSLSISLQSPIVEHLEINIMFHGLDDDDTFYDNLLNIWRPLDIIIGLSPGSRLHRVGIIINYAFHYEYDDDEEPDRDEIVKAVLDGLPMLNMKGIVFVDAFLRQLPDSDNEPSMNGHELDAEDEFDEEDELDEEEDPW